ncbi:hypothetical protein D3C85_1309210 [compost metagenome]
MNYIVLNNGLKRQLHRGTAHEFGAGCNDIIELLFVPNPEQLQIETAGFELIFHGVVLLLLNEALEQHRQAVDHLSHISCPL